MFCFHRTEDTDFLSCCIELFQIPRQHSPKFYTALKYADKILKKYFSFSMLFYIWEHDSWFVCPYVQICACVCVWKGLYNYAVIHEHNKREPVLIRRIVSKLYSLTIRDDSLLYIFICSYMDYMFLCFIYSQLFFHLKSPFQQNSTNSKALRVYWQAEITKQNE